MKPGRWTDVVTRTHDSNLEYTYMLIFEGIIFTFLGVPPHAKPKSAQSMKRGDKMGTWPALRKKSGAAPKSKKPGNWALLAFGIFFTTFEAGGVVQFRGDLLNFLETPLMPQSAGN